MSFWIIRLAFVKENLLIKNKFLKEKKTKLFVSFVWIYDPNNPVSAERPVSKVSLVAKQTFDLKTTEPPRVRVLKYRAEGIITVGGFTKTVFLQRLDLLFFHDNKFEKFTTCKLKIPKK